MPDVDDTVCINAGFDVSYSSGSSSVTSIAGEGSLAIAGGTLEVTGESAIDDLKLASPGTLTGKGEITVTGSFSWTGGTLAGLGLLVLADTASGTVSDADSKALGRHLRNDGSLTWEDGPISLQPALGTSHLDNYGAFYVTGDDATDWTPGGDIPLITNRPGALMVKSGSGTATLGDDKLDFVNDGTVNVSAGTLWLDVTLAGFGGSDITQGQWIVNDNATLKLWAANFVTNSTEIELLGPDAEIVDHNGLDAFRNLATNGGTLRLHGRALNLPGSLDNTGTLSLDPAAAVDVAGDFTGWGGSRLEYEISGTVAGTGFGTVNPAGTANLGGTIMATLQEPFVPDPSDEFAVARRVRARRYLRRRRGRPVRQLRQRQRRRGDAGEQPVPRLRRGVHGQREHLVAHRAELGLRQRARRRRPGLHPCRAHRGVHGGHLIGRLPRR